MGFLGMLLNKRDADAVSSDLHQQTMQTIHESNLQLERMREKSRRNTELLLAAEIANLKSQVAFLEEEVALCDARIEAYKGMRNKLLDMDDPKVAQAYQYQHWRIEDRALDKLLASGRLKKDPRPSKEWRERNGYVPPKQKQSSDKREPELA